MKIAENRWRMETEDSYSAKPSMETFWIQYIPTTSLWDRSLRSVAFQHFIVWNSFNKHQLNTHQAYSSCFGEFKIRIWIFFSFAFNNLSSQLHTLQDTSAFLFSSLICCANSSGIKYIFQNPFIVVHICITVNHSSANLLDSPLVNSKNRMAFVISKGMFYKYKRKNEWANE